MAVEGGWMLLRLACIPRNDMVGAIGCKGWLNSILRPCLHTWTMVLFMRWHCKFGIHKTAYLVLLSMLRAYIPLCRWAIEALAERFRIRRQRVLAILALKVNGAYGQGSRCMVCMVAPRHSNQHRITWEGAFMALCVPRASRCACSSMRMRSCMQIAAVT